MLLRLRWTLPFPVPPPDMLEDCGIENIYIYIWPFYPVSDTEILKLLINKSIFCLLKRWIMMSP